MFEWDDSYHDYQLQAMFTGQDNFAKTLSLSSQSLRMLQTKMSGVSLASLADCRQFVVQFPDFIRILQARWLLQSHLFSSSCWLVNLYYLHLLLGLSYDDITPTFSALHSIIGGGTRNQVIAGTITILALGLELYPTDVPSVASNLAVGLLHLLQQIGARSLPITFW
jgi:hypothetical protein